MFHGLTITIASTTCLHYVGRELFCPYVKSQGNYFAVIICFWWSIQVINFPTSRQLSCRDMCKIMTWFYYHIPRKSKGIGFLISRINWTAGMIVSLHDVSNRSIIQISPYQIIKPGSCQKHLFRQISNNKANLRDLIAATGLVIWNWFQIVNFSARVTVKFDGWPCKTIGHLFYATSSFVHHFVPIGEFKLKLQSGNAQSGSNWMIFRAVRPSNLTDDLAKQ